MSERFRVYRQGQKTGEAIRRGNRLDLYERGTKSGEIIGDNDRYKVYFRGKKTGEIYQRGDRFEVFEQGKKKRVIYQQGNRFEIFEQGKKTGEIYRSGAVRDEGQARASTPRRTTQSASTDPIDDAIQRGVIKGANFAGTVLGEILALAIDELFDKEPLYQLTHDNDEPIF